MKSFSEPKVHNIALLSDDRAAGKTSTVQKFGRELFATCKWTDVQSR